MPAELKLKYSRKWDAREDTQQGKGEDLGFHYALDASPDTWLIGGHRRAYFTAAVRSLLEQLEPLLTVLHRRIKFSRFRFS